MGVDLKCLPFDGEGPHCNFSHTVLCYNGAAGVDERLEGVDCPRVPDDFAAYVASGADGEPCYGVTTSTPYGGPLRYTTAALLALAMQPDARHDREGSPRPAVRAYLAALPPQTKVALYWC